MKHSFNQTLIKENKNISQVFKSLFLSSFYLEKVPVKYMCTGRNLRRLHLRMKTNTCKILAFVVMLMSLMLFSCRNKQTFSKTYYISNSGNNMNDGSFNKPFGTLDSTILALLKTGDTICYMGEEVFESSLYINSLHAGTKEKPIVITSHGNKKATIKSGNKIGLLVYNSEHIKIENLHFIGSGRNNGNTKEGVCLSNCNNISISKINIEGFQKAGLEIYCSSHVLADSIYAHDNGYGGIQVSGIYGRKDASSNIMIRRCFSANNPGDPTDFDNHSGNGIVVGRCKNVTIEYCTATNNGWDMPRKGNGPVGIWAYEADSVLIQYCISYRNKTSKGSQDGGGFDFDGGITNSTIQYCLSYENEGAGFSLFQYKGASPWYNNVIRYCISENDGNISNGMGGIFIWNSSEDPEELKDCYIYNNTIYNERGGAMCFEKKSKNKGFRFYNNIFVGKDDLNKGADISGVFLGNNWYSFSRTGFNLKGVRNFELWAKTNDKELLNGEIAGHNILPLFKNPGKTVLTDPYKLPEYDAYQLSDGCHVRDKGLNLKKQFGLITAEKDFNGNMVAENMVGACR